MRSTPSSISRAACTGIVLLAPALACGQTAIETIYIVPGSHLDVGFTDTRAGVRETRIAVLDEAIDAAESDAGFYWFEEGAWAFDAWHQAHIGDGARLAQMRRLLSENRIGVGATWLNPLIAPIPEGLPFLTFHIDEIERDFGYRPTVAVLNDVPSYPETLIDELSARGIRYLLVGANMFISRDLPSRLTRTPFYWESSSGARLLTYVDPESYVAGIALNPTCAKAFDSERFPADVDDMQTMRKAIADLIESSDSPYDSLVIQHAFDNWDTECAVLLADAVRRWNATERMPRIELTSPERYFRDIEARYGTELPVYRAEWGGQWDTQEWAMRPVSFWRLRHALQLAPSEKSREAKVAVGTALDHNIAGACSIWGFTESQVLTSADETNRLLRNATQLAGGPGAVDSLPAEIARPPSGPLPNSWVSVLDASDSPARFRAGPNFVGPFVRGDTGAWDIPFEFGADEERLVIHTRVDRTEIPGSNERLTYAVIEIPLKAQRSALRLAPEGVPNALANQWLLGRPPNDIVIGPDGVRIMGLDREIMVTSPLVVSWTLHAPDPSVELTWLQGLIFAQSELCELRGGDSRVFEYEVLNEGEPAIVDVDVQLRFR